MQRIAFRIYVLYGKVLRVLELKLLSFVIIILGRVWLAYYFTRNNMMSK